MEDTRWFEAVLAMYMNYTQAGGDMTFASIVGVYCVNPPADDGCPIGICPNPDVAGTLLRIAHYVTAFCLTILIFHAPNRVKDAFYYQMSTVYALLITCTVSLIRQNITQFHATVATCIALSPVSYYFLIYSVKAFWSEHRLDVVLGKEKHLNRGLVFFATAAWISIVVYISLKSTKDRFTQKSCFFSTVQEASLQRVFNTEGMDLLWFLSSPGSVLGIIAVLSWLIAIVLARKEIWPPGERYQPKFVTVWRTIHRRYPFVFFFSIGVAPIASWIWTTESTVQLWASNSWDVTMDLGFIWLFHNPWINDAEISPSFGQILALFIAVPPFLQVCQLVPQLWPWFINLTWVACCWKRKREAKRSETVDYIRLENPAPSEVQNSWKEGKKSGSQESIQN